MKKKVLVILFVLINGICGHLLFTYIDVNLNGPKHVTLNYNEKYEELGINAKNLFHIIDKDKYTLKIDGKVDTKKLGTYTIKYNIKYKGEKISLKRIVDVVDNTSPIIKSDLKEIKKEYCVPLDKSKLQYSATDNYDGDITNKVNIDIKKDVVIFDVSDSSGNKSTLNIPIITSEKPEKSLIINGYDRIYVPINKEYVDLGAYLSDECGLDTNKEVKVTGSVNTSKIGEYKITYTADNLTKTRIVIVYNPNITSKSSTDNEKVIYLTFDDGPGIYTESILNTLKKYNIKATFFVTAQFGSYVSLIKNEYEDGHSIGVHTLTHKWDIYSSVDSYINDFNAMNNIIEEYTGKKVNIFRFPGGSSNTVSKNYALGVVSAIASNMNSNGYEYFDWNVDSGDASGAVADTVYNNVVNGVYYCTKCVVLMHDIKYSTATSLDSILNTLTSQGYKFGTLNINSPTVKHGINN